MLRIYQQGEIHISYISAVCASADIVYERTMHDDDSTDGIIKKRITLSGDRFSDAQLRIQLKSTYSSSQYTDTGNEIIYKLKVKNYNDLCTPSTMPIILGLLILPEDRDSWVNWTAEELIIKGRMYWADFSNCQKSNNESSVSIHIDKGNVVNKESLLNILERIAKEEWP